MADDSTMPVPMRWIVGHDGSDGAGHATAWALAQARGRAGEVVLVQAWDISAAEFALTLSDVEQLAPTEQLGKVVAAAEAGAPPGIRVSGMTVRSGASHALLDAAEDADLLVVGARGLGGFRRLLLGSVSSQCATHATSPTIVVPATTDPTEVRKIVVGVDGSERATAALQWAAQWADPEAHIRAVGVWTPPRTGEIAMPQHIADELDAARERFATLLDEVEAGFDRQPLDREFVTGDPAQVLSSEAEDADLLVVGQRGLTGFSAAVLGSVATHVIHHATNPVAVIPDPA